MARAFLRRLTTPLIAVAVLVTFGGVPASAAPIVFTFGGADFSGPTNNTGGTVTVTISDILGGVEIEIENDLDDPDAWPSAFYFNTTAAPLDEPGTTGSCVSCPTIGAPTFDFGLDEFQADGDGKYDIRINMDNAPPADRLLPGETATLQILSTTVGFNADSFLALSAPGGGNGPFVAAIHVQSLPPNNGGSDWLTTVPEPSTLLLLGVGLLGTRMLRRREKTRV